MSTICSNTGVCYVDCVADDTAAVPNGHDMAVGDVGGEAAGDADSAAVNDSSSESRDTSQAKTSDKTDTAKAAESGDEVVVIQDTGFNISIVAPGVDPFDLPVCNSLLTHPLGYWRTAPHAVVLTLMREHYYSVYLYMVRQLMY